MLQTSLIFRIEIENTKASQKFILKLNKRMAESSRSDTESRKLLNLRLRIPEF